MNFRSIATAARNNSTPENVLALVEAYASNGCATYPVDGELFFATYMGTAPAGYTFKVCTTYDGFAALTVERAANAVCCLDELRAEAHAAILDIERLRVALEEGEQRARTARRQLIAAMG